MRERQQNEGEGLGNVVDELGGGGNGRRKGE